MPLAFAPDSVLVEAGAFWPTTTPGQLDTETQLVRDDEVQFRLVWELEYRDGKVVRQYTRSGDQIFQVLFGRMKRKTDVKFIRVFDFKRPRSCGPLTVIGVPPGAEVDFLMTCRFVLSPDRTPLIQRVYTYGWKEANGKAAYLHINPAVWPPKQWLTANRNA